MADQQAGDLDNLEDVVLSEKNLSNLRKMVSITDSITRNVSKMNDVLERMLEDRQMLEELEDMLAPKKSKKRKSQEMAA